MLGEHLNDKAIHINNTFTDLFQLLKKFNQERMHLDYTPSEISMILLHTENAITNLLHGLQVIGELVASSTQTENNELLHFGHFVALIANLMAALTVLRSDCELPTYDEQESVNAN